MRIIRVKREFLNLIKAGKKTLEVRVAHPLFKSIRPGQQLRIALRDDEQVVQITDSRRYDSFEQMLDVEDYTRIAPQMEGKGQLLALLREIYPPEKEKLGVIVLQMEKAE